MKEDAFDQKFVNISGKVVNCICLSVLWAVFSLPVVTAGAATAALLEGCRRTVLKDEGYVFRTFRNCFRLEWKRATPVWLAVLAAEAALYLDLRLILSLAGQNRAWHVLTAFCLLMMLVAAAVGIFALMQELQICLPVKEMMKNAVLLAFGSIGRAVCMGALWAVTAAVCLLFPFLLVILPGAAGALCFWLAEGPIRKYCVNMSGMRAER